MPLGNDRSDREIWNNPLENFEISKKMNLQLKSWYLDKNIVRHNWFDHIKLDFQGSECATWPLVKVEVP